jgi:hypothetical protein
MAYQMPPLKNDKEGWSYNWFEVMSALRKSIKLHDKEAAIYWVNVVLSGSDKGGAKSVAKQLWIMSTEDVYDADIVLRAAAVYQMADKVPETDQVYYLAAAMCDAKMWWEDDKGALVDEYWAKAIGDLKDPERRREIPVYALDRHTQRGWAAQRSGRESLAGKGFDDRFSGTDLGRMKSRYMFLRDGFLDAASAVFRTRDGKEDFGFLEWWRTRRKLQGMSRGDLEPNDPLGPEDLEAEPGALFSESDVRPPVEGPPKQPRPAPYKPDTEIAAGPHGWEC